MKATGPEVRQITSTELPTAFGVFRCATFDIEGESSSVIALTHGQFEGDEPALVRIHSECLTGDALGSVRCDCGEQLALALETIGQATAGVLVYLSQEGRGIGLVNKIRAYALQDGGLDTHDANLALGFPADGREYASASHILHYLNVRRIRLLTNNPEKQRALASHGLEVIERIPLLTSVRPENRGYLYTKMIRMGHALTLGNQSGGAESSKQGPPDSHAGGRQINGLPSNKPPA